MCVKEFLGYTCGHCAVPYLRQCPLAAQNKLFPYCKFPADRPIHVPEMCHPCSRVVWNKKVLQEEEQHKRAHEARLCACEVVFDEEERVRRKTDRQTGLRTEAQREVGVRSGDGDGLESHLGELPSLSDRHTEHGNGYLGYRIPGPSNTLSNVRHHHVNGGGHGIAWYPGEVHYGSIPQTKGVLAKQIGIPGNTNFPERGRQRDSRHINRNSNMIWIMEQSLSMDAEDHLAADEALMTSCDDTQSAEVERPNYQKPMIVSGDMLLKETPRPETPRPPTPPARTASAPT